MIEHDIRADYDDLIELAAQTAGDFLRQARYIIDEQFGDKFAEKNPSLVVEVAKLASADFSASMMKLAAQNIHNGLQAIAEAVTNN